MGDQLGSSSPLPLWFALAPALTALAILGRWISGQGGLLPGWLDGLVLVGALALLALPFVQRLALRRRRRAATVSRRAGSSRAGLRQSSAAGAGPDDLAVEGEAVDRGAGPHDH